DGVVAVGEVGFDDQTATEEKFFRLQIELAARHELPLLVHLPHRDKVKGLERTLAIVREMKVPPERVLIDHNTEETVPQVVETGHYIGFSIYPDTKMTEERVGTIFERYGVERMIINRATDGGRTILTYCTNVHAIEDFDSVLAALARYCAPIRRRLGARRLSLGLWLSRRSASELSASSDARTRLREALAANGLELATLNGFPYGDFHAERVKEEVYRPDWADPRRHRYTLDLSHI